jgi:DNA polymerase-4
VRLLGVGVRLGDTETVEQLRLFDDALPAAIVEAVSDSATE